MTAITYIVTHRGYRSVKVGYTEVGSDRLEQLAKLGWEPFRHLHLATPRIARDVEQAALFQIRYRLYVPVHLTPDQMLSGGWTETVNARLLSAADAWQIVCEEAGAVQMAPVVAASGRQHNRPAGQYKRTKGDTPRYVPVARKEAARTARAAQVGAQPKSKPKRRGARQRPGRPTEN